MEPTAQREKKYIDDNYIEFVYRIEHEPFLVLYVIWHRNEWHFLANKNLC